MDLPDSEDSVSPAPGNETVSDLPLGPGPVLFDQGELNQELLARVIKSITFSKQATSLPLTKFTLETQPCMDNYIQTSKYFYGLELM